MRFTYGSWGRDCAVLIAAMLSCGTGAIISRWESGAVTLKLASDSGESGQDSFATDSEEQSVGRVNQRWQHRCASIVFSGVSSSCEIPHACGEVLGQESDLTVIEAVFCK